MEQWLDFVLSLWMWRENTQNKAMNQSSVERNPYCYSWHEANIRGLQVIKIKINLSKSKVKLHPYSKSIFTTKCVISPLSKINMHHEMFNCAPTPNRYAPPARAWTRCTFQILQGWQDRRTSHVPPSLPPPLIFKAKLKIFVTLPS